MSEIVKELSTKIQELNKEIQSLKAEVELLEACQASNGLAIPKTGVFQKD